MEKEPLSVRYLKLSDLTATFSGAPFSFQSGISSDRVRGSITAPERICAPTSAPFSRMQIVSSRSCCCASCARRMPMVRPEGPAPTMTTSKFIASLSTCSTISPAAGCMKSGTGHYKLIRHRKYTASDLCATAGDAHPSHPGQNRCGLFEPSLVPGHVSDKWGVLNAVSTAPVCSRRIGAKGAPSGGLAAPRHVPVALGTRHPCRVTLLRQFSGCRPLSAIDSYILEVCPYTCCFVNRTLNHMCFELFKNI